MVRETDSIFCDEGAQCTVIIIIKIIIIIIIIIIINK